MGVKNIISVSETRSNNINKYYYFEISIGDLDGF